MKLPGVEGEPGSVYKEHNGGWKYVHWRQKGQLNDRQATGSLKKEIKKLQSLSQFVWKAQEE